MRNLGVTYGHLKSEIKELGRKYHKFPDEDLFVLWFLRAYITDNLEIAANAITNGPNDKGIEADKNISDNEMKDVGIDI